MSLLAPIGTASYNGVDLNPAECETLGVFCKPIPDSSGRTVSYVQTTIRIKTVVYTTPPLTTDGTIQTYRRRLSAYGGAFQYDTKGCGIIHANVPGERYKDVCYGPKPQILELHPKGQFAWDLIWEVVVCLPECDTASYQKQLMEVNYSLDYGVDSVGYSTRTYKGHLAIPVTRGGVNNRLLQDNADAYREQIWPSPLPGFRRTRSDFSMNEAKTRLDFTIQDEEMGLNVPPPGVASIKASMRIGVNEPGNFMKFGGTLSADYEMQKGTSPQIAYDHFIALWQDRRVGIGAIVPPKKGGFDAIGARAFAYPVSFDASESDIFGRTHCAFSIHFLVITSLRTFFTGTLWQPVAGSDWGKWAISMSSLTGPRGTAGLAFSNSDDAMIDLCIKPPTTSSLRSSKPTRALLLPGQNRLQSDILDPDFTWIFYENRLWLEIMDGTVGHRPLAQQKLTSTNKDSAPFKNTNGSVPFTVPNAPDLVIQQRHVASYFVWMEGKATRIGFPITPPTLESIGGVVPVDANVKGCGFVQTSSPPNPDGLVTYKAQWRFRYLIPRPPATLLPPDNPLAPTQGSQSQLTKRGIFPQ